MYTEFWWGNLKEKEPPGRPRRRWRIIIKIDLQEVDYEGWTASIWFRIGTGGGLL